MSAKYLINVFVIFSALSLFFLSDRAFSLDITQVVQGIIKEVSGGSITIIQSNIGRQLKILTDPYTTIQKVQNLRQLKPGDRVQIDYKTISHKNIASRITKIEIGNKNIF